ncbi:hypothetical protein DRN69_05155 [Candidatus Pacearchaeota archaeon]|nr:MAG: hypothetical protein DRN69_05155 [Candidatus Pacearchaeota archaeon]
MGSLNKFLGKPKEVEIDGEKITLHPLTVKNMDKFSKQDASDEEKVKMSKEILKLSIPDATEEEIENLPLEVFTKLMEEINKLNGFVDEGIDKIRLRKRLAQQNKE